MTGEKITKIIPVTATEEQEDFIAMVTRKGIIKRTRLTEFKNTRKNGIIAISIDDDDELAFVRMTDGSDYIFISTSLGYSIRFDENNVRAMGRTARGVKAINMREGDFVVDMAICKADDRILTVTETGYGRISPVSDYRLQSRGGKGIINYRTSKYGRVAATVPVTDNDDVIMISSSGIIIRIFAGDISEFARPSKGVRVMRVGEGEKILSVALADHDDSQVNDTPEAADADAGTVTAEDLAEDSEADIKADEE